MTYEEALSYIHSVSWRGSRPGLERIGKLCHALSDPQESLKFIHVAGTNGKGSFCALADAVLREAGYRTGLFTSPFVERFNERISIDGRPISDKELCDVIERIMPVAESLEDPPTEFELITAAALLFYAENGCDHVVFEAGMGGRLDSTNIIKTPVLSVICRVALDHMQFLGDTVEKIAGEKAGIIKPGVPVLYGGEDDICADVIRRRAAEMGSDFYLADHSAVTVRSYDLCGTSVDFSGMTGVNLPLLGTYQPYNLSNLIAAVAVLEKQGITIGKKALRKGVESCSWKARFELLNTDPVFIFDGAHNVNGVTAACESIDRYFPNEKLILITGVMADKEYASMSELAARRTDCVFTLTPDNPRALPAAELAKVYSSYPDVSAFPCGSIAEAVERALTSAAKTGKKIIAMGSLYMYGDVKKALVSLLSGNS